MIGFLIFAISLLVFTGSAVVIDEIYKYRKQLQKEVTISYNQFALMYQIVPDKWEFEQTNKYLYLLYYDSDNNIHGENVYMNTYFEQLRLKRLYKKHKRLKTQNRKNDKQQKLVKCWNEDMQGSVAQSKYKNLLKYT